MLCSHYVPSVHSFYLQSEYQRHTEAAATAFHGTEWSPHRRSILNSNCERGREASEISASGMHCYSVLRERGFEYRTIIICLQSPIHHLHCLINSPLSARPLLAAPVRCRHKTSTRGCVGLCLLFRSKRSKPKKGVSIWESRIQ